MHFYSMSYETLCNLPMGVFWELSRNVNRVQAVNDKRLYAMLVSLVSSGGPNIYEMLTKEHGDIFVTELTPKGKKARFAKIKSFFGGGK